MDSPLSSKRSSVIQERGRSRRSLQQQLDDTGKGLNRVMDLAQPLLEQQKLLEAQLAAIDQGQDCENLGAVNLATDLAHLQREQEDGVLADFGVNRSPVRSATAGKESKTQDARSFQNPSFSPSRMAQSARRARQNMSQASRPQDIEFATSIGNKLVAEVRAQQQQLIEKEDRIRELLVELERRERGFESLQTEAKTALVQAERLKSVNWDLEVALHKSDAEVTELREVSARQAGEIKKLTATIEKQTEQAEAQRDADNTLREQLASQEMTHAAAIAELRSEKELIRRDVSDLQNKLDAANAELEQQKKLAQLRDRSRSPIKRSLEPIDSDPEPTTPDRSPQLSPIKGTPSRNVTLEAETLKGSLLSSHRMLQHSKQLAMKEKAEKIDLRRQLKEALDELEELKQLQGSQMPRRRFMRGTNASDRGGRPRSDHATETRRTTGESVIDEEDVDWEEAEHSGSDHQADPDESVYSTRYSRSRFSIDEGTVRACSRDGFGFESDVEDSSSSPHGQQQAGRRRVLGTHALMSGSQVFASSKPLFAELEGRSLAGSSSAHSPETIRGTSHSSSNTPSKLSVAAKTETADAGTMTTAAWRSSPRESAITTQFVYEDPANAPPTPRPFKSSLTFIQEDPANMPDSPTTPRAVPGPKLTFIQENPADFTETPQTSPDRTPTILSPTPRRLAEAPPIMPPIQDHTDQSQPSFLPSLANIVSQSPPTSSSRSRLTSPAKSFTRTSDKSAADERASDGGQAQVADEAVLAKRVIAPLRRKSHSTLKSQASRDSLQSSGKQEPASPVPTLPPIPNLPLPKIETITRPAMVDAGVQPDDEWHLENYLAGPAGPQRQFYLYSGAPPVVQHVGRSQIEHADAAVQAGNATADASTSAAPGQHTAGTSAMPVLHNAGVSAAPEQHNTGTQAAPIQRSANTQSKPESRAVGTDAPYLEESVIWKHSTGIQASTDTLDAWTSMTPDAERIRQASEEYTQGMSPKARRFFGVDNEPKVVLSSSPVRTTKTEDKQNKTALAMEVMVETEVETSYERIPKEAAKEKLDLRQAAATVKQAQSSSNATATSEETTTASVRDTQQDSPVLPLADLKQNLLLKKARTTREEDEVRFLPLSMPNVPLRSTEPAQPAAETSFPLDKVPVSEERLRELLRKETELAASQQAIAQLTREAALKEKPLPLDPPRTAVALTEAEKIPAATVPAVEPEHTVANLRVNKIPTAAEETDDASDTSCWTTASVADSDMEDGPSETEVAFSPWTHKLRKSASTTNSPTSKAERVLGKTPTDESPMSTRDVSQSMRASSEETRPQRMMAPPLAPSTARDTMRSRQQEPVSERPGSRMVGSATMSDFDAYKRSNQHGPVGRPPVRSQSQQSVSSLSSFATDVDSRFQARDKHPARAPAVQDEGLDQATMNAVKRTMIGMCLYKYMRRPGWQGLSDKRHQRFFWLNPYTQTLYWSAFNPVNAPENAIIKSTPVLGLYTEADYNPLPPGIQQRTICIETPTRLLKVTALSSHDHEDWMRALDHLIHGSLAGTSATDGKKQKRSLLSDFSLSPNPRQRRPSEPNSQYTQQSGRPSESTHQSERRSQQSARPSESPWSHANGQSISTAGQSAVETPAQSSFTRSSVTDREQNDSHSTMRPGALSRATSTSQLSSIGTRVTSIFKSPRMSPGKTYRHYASKERLPLAAPAVTFPRSNTQTALGRISRGSSTTSLSRMQQSDYSTRYAGDSSAAASTPITMDDLADCGLENVRSCCGGKHDVGTLCRRPSSSLSNHR